ncbi:MAG TPA: PQQ-binding-like beta-propeller repeat protein [Pirellulales bacterium]|jgi:hypothetical protein|nr:PQQ-binding-like beta-propeller repeat protein [Pirellulales bacterium]
MKRIIFAVVLACNVTVASAADWPRFRGPGGSATSDETGLPTTWSAHENVVWRIELPGAGTSSPVAVGDRIWLTCYSGYALSVEEPGDINNLMRHVVCLDRTSGAIVWTKDFKAAQPESEYSGGNNTWHGYASSTPIVHGDRLYVFFGRSGVYCLDARDGRELWHADVGTKTAGWGSANSLVLFEDLLIVNASIESTSLRALDAETGKEVWAIDEVRGARNTPILVDLPGGGTELVFSLPGAPEGWIVGHDPRTGKELWRAGGIPDTYVCASVVAHAGIVYAIGGRKNTALAVRAGGRGDVTETHRLWRTSKGANVASPVYHNGHLYWVHERKGAVYCLDAATGDLVYEERLEPRPGIVYSSLTEADGKLYAVSQHSGTFVVAASPKFQFLAHNVFDDDDSRTNACLAVSRGQLLLRNDRYLYCIGSK